MCSACLSGSRLRDRETERQTETQTERERHGPDTEPGGDVV